MVFCSVFTTWESVDCDHIGRLIKCTAIKNFLLIVLIHLSAQSGNLVSPIPEFF